MNIAGRSFEGPFQNTSDLRDESGVYVILRKKDDNWNIVDVGESESVYSRVEHHDRKSCWERNEYSHVAAHYTNETDRIELEQQIREQYNPPCGEE